MYFWNAGNGERITGPKTPPRLCHVYIGIHALITYLRVLLERGKQGAHNWSCVVKFPEQKLLREELIFIVESAGEEKD